MAPKERTPHTPGPWHCYQPNNSPRQITDGQMRICTVTDRSEAVANARLIAAAPELLTALQCLLDEFKIRTALIETCDMDPAEENAMDAAEQVIAKAKGQP